MYIRRILEKDIIEAAQYFPAVAILGPRQSGKTTMVKMVFDKHIYVSLEEPDKRMAAINDPRSFLAFYRNNYGVIIDEFQYAPELLSYIQTIVDKEQKLGFFVLTGSQNFLMNRSISQSLAGRVSLHTLLPLCCEELDTQQILPKEIEVALYKGLYPSIYTKEIPPNRLYSQYLRTYVERDVRELAHVGDLTIFQTFLTMCAERVGQLINFSEFARECRISDQTVRRWLSILEASYIVFLLRPFEKTLSKRLVKSPKLYFYDPGLVCNLLKIQQDDLITHPKRGSIFESFIISEIIKHFYNRGKDASVYFWQDHGKHEVDCVIDYGSHVMALEIKAGRTVNKSFFSGLSEWKLVMQKPVKTSCYIVYGANKEQITGFKDVLSWQSFAKILPA